MSAMLSDVGLHEAGPCRPWTRKENPKTDVLERRIYTVGAKRCTLMTDASAARESNHTVKRVNSTGLVVYVAWS